ncbi:hypothetical protein F4818DRAFT_413878 [Hypoxylon cercidicola]|nr:hypothetical protein F4818DRAFT_413878 [Hypoxylon cercidicola]
MCYTPCTPCLRLVTILRLVLGKVACKAYRSLCIRHIAGEATPRVPYKRRVPIRSNRQVALRGTCWSWQMTCYLSALEIRTLIRAQTPSLNGA